MMSGRGHIQSDGQRDGGRRLERWEYFGAAGLLAIALLRRLISRRRAAAPHEEPAIEREEEAAEAQHIVSRFPDESQAQWLGAKWSSWGCVAVLGSLGIAVSAIGIILYGMFTMPMAFGQQGVLSPDPALVPPFEPPPDERLIGVPPIGVSEFTTGHTLRLADGVLFQVTRTALDWAPAWPRTPEREIVVVEVRLENNGPDLVPLSSAHFRMETARNGQLEPAQMETVRNLLGDQIIRSGTRGEGVLIFVRPDVHQVRRYLLYDPPFRPGTIRILLVP